jgi:tRNA(Ile)-lysidine synthase
VTAYDSIEAVIAGVLRAHTGRIIVGFSGGLDSTVLLHASAGLIEDRNRLVVLHVNHGLNPRADRWQRHCQAVSEVLGVRCTVEKVAVESHGSREDAARRARYAAFAMTLEAGDVLLLGHHLDDQAETVLWRLLRGGGAAALAGIPMRRRLGRGELVRPLLEYPRDDLEAWARARHITWIDDDSNADVRFERNYLRHAVFPVLRQRWPDVAARLAHAASKFAVEAQLLERALDRRLDECGATAATLPIAALDDAAQPLLRQWLARAGIAGVRERVLTEVVRQARGAPDRSPDVVVADGVSVRRYLARLHLVRQPRPPFEAVAWMLGRALELPNGTLTSVRATGAGLRASVAAVTVRPRHGGERLRLPGGRGSRTVKRLLQQAQLPPWQRVAYPLLYFGDRLAAVPGIAVDEAFVDDSEAGWRILWQSR